MRDKRDVLPILKQIFSSDLFSKKEKEAIFNLTLDDSQDIEKLCDMLDKYKNVKEITKLKKLITQ